MKVRDSKVAIIDQILTSSQIIKECTSLVDVIKKTIDIITKCFNQGNKLVIFGNGGSAADAQHIAAELVGRFKITRQGLPAISLTTDTSILTAISNDFSSDLIFSRQCESLIKPGDVALGISTSGKSLNIKKGLTAAKKQGAKTIGLLGNKGGTIKQVCDVTIIVNSKDTPQIQEAHRIIYHIICNMVEQNIIKGKK